MPGCRTLFVPLSGWTTIDPPLLPLLQVRPNFIASTEDYHVSCKHGESECAGDEQQLCMYRYASADAFWQFVMCQNADPPSIGQVHT